MTAECWPAPEICDECCTSQIETLDPAIWQMMQDMAVAFLDSATGYRYGLCETTYRPCRRKCGDYWGGLPTPWRISGQWVNIPCGACTGECGCTNDISEVDLPRVDSVVAVTVDGVEFPPESTVAVYDYHRVIRTDGGQWPGCQDLSATEGPGTWSITVMQGYEPPAGASLIAGLLACEFAKACLGEDGCRLPKRLQTITRQGVTAAFQDQFESLSDLHTGIFEIDQWISMARNAKWMAPSVTSIDAPRPTVLTWPEVMGS